MSPFDAIKHFIPRVQISIFQYLMPLHLKKINKTWPQNKKLVAQKNHSVKSGLFV